MGELFTLIYVVLVYSYTAVCRVTTSNVVFVYDAWPHKFKDGFVGQI